MATNVIDCYVKLPSGRTITLDLVPNDTINKICSKVAEEESVPSDRVEMKYQGKILKKTHTAGYLGVCKETILKAEITKVKQLNIFIKMQSGKTVPISIENVSPLRYIKDAIHAKEEIAPNRQILKVSGRTLENMNQRCIDAGITDECVLTMEVKEVKPAKKSTSLSQGGFRGSGGSILDTDSEDEEGDEVGRKTKIGKKKKGYSSHKGLTEDFTNLPDEPQELDEDLKENCILSVMGNFDAMGKNVEVAFCFDTTGSMYSCLVQVRKNLKETVTKLIQEIPNIRISIMAVGDYCDHANYVVEYKDFTNDVDILTRFADNVESTGGGDSPECYEWALRKAQHLDWSQNSAKAFVLIADDLPHPPSYTDQHISWHKEIDVLKRREIKVYGVRAQNNLRAAPFYQEISEHTGGAYIEFNNFAAISEMFSAVCYKEAGDEQFEQFCNEYEQNTEQEANVKEEVKNILKQIDEADAKKKEDKPKRYVAEAWWDHKLDEASPYYSYIKQTDEWFPHREVPWKSKVTRIFSLRRGSARSKSASAGSRSKRESSSKCVVM